MCTLLDAVGGSSPWDDLVHFMVKPSSRQQAKSGNLCREEGV